MTTSGVQRVQQKHRNGQRADAARNRRDRARDFLRRLEIDVADELRNLDRRAVFVDAVFFDAVDPDVDNDRARLEHVAGNELRFADRRDDDIGFAENFGEAVKI